MGEVTEVMKKRFRAVAMLALGDSALRKEADAMTFVGCDLHTPMQQMAVLDNWRRSPGGSTTVTRLRTVP
jgi:hypothetical protein